MRKITYMFVSVILLFVLGFSSAYAEETIKIGVITAASGKYTPLGQGNITAINLAAKMLNKQGGVLGRKVEIARFA